MKKIMMIAAVVALASAAQASSFAWKLQTKSDYGNMNLYALTGTTAENVLKAFTSTTEADWSKVVSGVTPKTTTAPSARANTDGTTVGVSDGDNIVFVLVDGAIAEGNNYYVVNDYTIPTGSTFDPPAGGKAESIAVALAGSGMFTAAGPTPTPTPTPEPTSGLLLVLGMAGLALRRRRA